HDVNFDFDGFFQPVDMAGANEVRAGASVPFKFTIGGDKGLAILAEGSPGSKPVACTGSGSAGPLEETVSAGSSGLQYDPATGTYTYSWKTSKGWANTCRAFTLTLVDGTTHTALFDFTR
ncbi:MAG TPA: PxKF domain-containing protein, partial [Candidatus Limnocylindrales bacterium]|nr:PxKF domain-containing protein [Candidatus Limnocylindrales bacterium]